MLHVKRLLQPILIVVSGEITSSQKVDYEKIARQTVF